MISFINFKRQSSIYKKKILSGIDYNIKNGDFILGKNVSLLENKISNYVKSKYCLTCSSGTDALLMSLMAHDVKKDDIIFTTVYSYISTAEVISLLGAIPIFIDIESKTYNIDPNKLEEAINNIKKKNFTSNMPNVIKKIKKINLKGIIAVNLFGNPFEYDKINYIAKKNKLFLVEDAAQSFGAIYKNKLSGTLGDISCFSFYPTKSLSCYGDGGAITTNSKKLYNLIKSIRVHGKSNKNGNFDRLGLTGRLDSIQATVLLEKLKNFKKEQYSRRKIAKNYVKALQKNKYVKTQKINDNSKSTFSVFSLEFTNQKIKKTILKKLKSNKIQYNVYYKKPMHLEKVFKEYNYKKSNFPIAEKLSENILCIPIDPYIKKAEINKIIKTVNYEK